LGDKLAHHEISLCKPWNIADCDFLNELHQFITNHFTSLPATSHLKWRSGVRSWLYMYSCICPGHCLSSAPSWCVLWFQQFISQFSLLHESPLMLPLSSYPFKFTLLHQH
jgi:hypothetical protein